ncbi:MAG: hypothetical protein LBI17_01620 [Rickettsiales bacterium]|jgi:hypothetical protein|nr:hypothetical protein [Rickettsiales bacterium]
MARVFCSISDSYLARVGADAFRLIEKYIIAGGLGSDKDDFEAIKERLLHPPVLNAEQFAEEAIYVILAGGFRQKVAKRKFGEIMAYIRAGGEVSAEKLLPIFNNRNKMNAVAKIWNGRLGYRGGFYALGSVEEKLRFLARLPHIGEITKNHLARNLGISNVKYDVWIQRLGIALCGGPDMRAGFPLDPGVKDACDRMFSEISAQTGYDRGYVDVVLWKACQTGILSFV